LIDVDHSRKFNEELPGLLNEIGEILQPGGNRKANDVLERLRVRNAPVNTRFSFYSASQTYNGLGDAQQKVVQNFKDALTLLGSTPPSEYLTGVVVLSRVAFGQVYKGKWEEKQIAVKKFSPVAPPVYLIPSDIIRYLTLDYLQDDIERLLR
jgi:hypothetical protein